MPEQLVACIAVEALTILECLHTKGYLPPAAAAALNLRINRSATQHCITNTLKMREGRVKWSDSGMHSGQIRYYDITPMH